MATSVKNAIARALVEGVIIDLMLKTNTDNVVLDDNGTEVTLSAKLAEYIAALNGKATPADITNALNSYVKKDGSKVLSTNDFTAAYKTKLDGIATGANKYTHPSYTAQSSGFWKVTVDATGHVSAVTAVTKADITNLGIPSTNTTYADATQSAHGLMTAADKKKLDGIASGAQVNKIETIKVNGTAQTVTSKGVNIAMPVIYAQASEPTGLKAGDLWFQIL